MFWQRYRLRTRASVTTGVIASLAVSLDSEGCIVVGTIPAGNATLSLNSEGCIVVGSIQ